MLRAAWLTYRMHRFEVVFSAVVLAVFAGWVWLVSSQMLDLNIPDTCWPRDADGDWAQPVCDELMSEFWGIQNGAGYPRIGLSLLAPVVGLILGVPIVAREIELRTTELAWSLALRRSRWLLSRLLPMVVLALVGFVVLGWLGERLFTAMAVGRASPDLTEVASRGPTLIARGLMALGIGLLTGALLGRTLPALVIATIAVLAWGLVAVPMVQAAMFEDRAVWVREIESGWREGASPIGYLDSGYFDVTKPGVDGEPGARLSDDGGLSLLAKQRCGPYPESASRKVRIANEECRDRVYERSGWDRMVPASTYGDFQLIEMLLGLAIGGTAILLTFPVVARRRPS